MKFNALLIFALPILANPNLERREEATSASGYYGSTGNPLAGLLGHLPNINDALKKITYAVGTKDVDLTNLGVVVNALTATLAPILNTLDDKLPLDLSKTVNELLGDVNDIATINLDTIPAASEDSAEAPVHEHPAKDD